MPAKTRKSAASQQAGRVSVILDRLRSAYPDAHCALNHRNPLELLIATILSAQCTDERVNVVTRDLFAKYRRPEDYLSVAAEELENDIHSTGFFRNKAKSIQGACRRIVVEFQGRMPQTLEELITLPGVARKTANVVLGVAFGKSEGIVVDTHVYRVSRRLDLSHSETPETVETDLMQVIPKERWISFSHEVIFHGRRVCQARRPLCAQCPIEEICRSEDKAAAFPVPPGRRTGRKGGSHAR
jgi:endonuclease III